MPVEDLIRSQLQSEEELQTNILLISNYYMTVNFKSLQKKAALSFDFPFGTVMTKLKLFHVIERKIYHARQTFEIICHL